MMISFNYELVEFLLIKGANPNCISSDIPQSLLDYVEFDYRNDGGLGSNEYKIIKLLKSYGAKNLNEMKG